MHEYDTALKLLLQGRAELVVRELTGVEIRKWLTTELPEIRSTRMDLLGETADNGLIHIELQSANDAAMPLRMAEYCLGAYRVFNRLPRQIVLYVGEPALRMPAHLQGPDMWFRYRAVDIRELDGERLIASDNLGDNVIAILARLRDGKKAVRRILAKIASAGSSEREAALNQLLILAGLRRLEEYVEREAKNMPILNDIRDHKVLGREFKRGWQEGELTILRRLIGKRFGSVPQWAEEQLVKRSAAELEELSVRILDATSIEELLKP